MVSITSRWFRPPAVVFGYPRHWEEGKWPEPDFYHIMNADVRRCEVVNDRLIVLEFENGIEMHLADSSDQYESMQISFEGDDALWVI